MLRKTKIVINRILSIGQYLIVVNRLKTDLEKYELCQGKPCSEINKLIPWH